MLEYYAQIRSAHIALVIASALLFAVRGMAVLAGRRWPLAIPVRVFGHAVDTALLTAGIMLVVMLPAEVFENGWLAAKLLLLAGYVAAGFIALRRARTPRSRAACLAVAMLLFASIFGIARLHHPLGWLALAF